MALHPDFPVSPYAPLVPEHRWIPADEALRSTAYEKLLPPLVARVRKEVFAWRQKGYAGASATSISLLRWWFETEHLLENADGSLSPFNYYFAQHEAVESVIWLFDVDYARDKFDPLRIDASGAVSSGMFDEDWPILIVETKGRAELDLPQKMTCLRQWFTDASSEENGHRYDFAFVDQSGFEKHAPQTFSALISSFMNFQK